MAFLHSPFHENGLSCCWENLIGLRGVEKQLKTTHRVKPPDEELSSPDCASQHSSIQTDCPNNSWKHRSPKSLLGRLSRPTHPDVCVACVMLSHNEEVQSVVVVVDQGGVDTL